MIYNNKIDSFITLFRRFQIERLVENVISREHYRIDKLDFPPFFLLECLIEENCTETVI